MLPALHYLLNYLIAKPIQYLSKHVIRVNEYMNRKYIFISLLLSTSFFSTQLLADKERVYTIGVVPQFEIRHIRKIWNPILREIEKKTGYKIKLVGSPTIPDFSKEIKEGRLILLT